MTSGNASDFQLLNLERRDFRLFADMVMSHHVLEVLSKVWVSGFGGEARKQDS